MCWALVACDRVPLTAPPPEVGAGTAAALVVIQSARQVAATPPPAFLGCHLGLPADGPLTVETRIAYTLQDATTTTRYVTHRWRRDRAGAIAHAVEVEGAMPDGRYTTRTLERRWIGDEVYVALDGRFALAPEPVAPEGAQDPTDALLAALSWDDGWRAADPGAGLCAGQSALGLPAVAAAEVTWEGRQRRGWIQWGATDERHLLVHFSEVVAEEASDIARPSEVWELAPDMSVEVVDSLLSAGFDAGWLLTPRESYGEETHSSP